MPLQPDSPNLNPVSHGSGPVSGSPFKLSSSPIIRQPFHSRNTFMSINEERLQEILENSRDLKTQLDIIKEGIDDPESHNKRKSSHHHHENTRALTSLLEDTKLASERASESIRESLPLILSTIQTEKERQHMFPSIMNSILEQSHEISRRTQSQEAQIARLLASSKSQEAEFRRDGGLVTNNDLDRIMARKNNTVLDQLSEFIDVIGAQQKQTLGLIHSLKERGDVASGDYEKVLSVIGKESEAIITDITKAIKQSQDISLQSINSIPKRISELEDSFTSVLDKAVLSISSKATGDNNYMIPEISIKLNEVSTAVEKANEENIQAHYNTVGGLYDRLEELIIREQTEQLASTSAVTETQYKDLQGSINTRGETLEKKLTIGLSVLEEKLHTLLQDFEKSSKDQESRYLEQGSYIRELVDGALKCTAGNISTQQSELLSEISGLDDKLRAVSEATTKAIENSSSQLVEVLSKGLEDMTKGGGSSQESKLKAEIAELSSQFAAFSKQVQEHFNKNSDMEARMSETVNKELATMTQKMDEMEAKRALELEKVQLTKIAKLEQELKAAMQQAAAAEARAQAVEDNITHQKQAHQLELQSLKFMSWDVEKYEAKISDLEKETSALREEKARIQAELAGVNSTYELRVEELAGLELRVEAFERRLGQALLNRSKAILGSAAMTVINSNSGLAHTGSTVATTAAAAAVHNSGGNGYHHHSRPRDSQASAYFYTNNGGSRCSSSSSNVDSLPQLQQQQQQPEMTEGKGLFMDSDSDDGGKENEFVAGPPLMMKKQRGSNVGVVRGPFGVTPVKHRSISLFTPGELSD